MTNYFKSFRISRSPNLASVTPGAVVNYDFRYKPEVLSKALVTDLPPYPIKLVWRRFVSNSAAKEKKARHLKEEKTWDSSPYPGEERSFEVNYEEVGAHSVTCEATWHEIDLKQTVLFEKDQDVGPLIPVLEKKKAELAEQEPVTPTEYVLALRKYTEVLRAAWLKYQDPKHWRKTIKRIKDLENHAAEVVIHCSGFIDSKGAPIRRGYPLRASLFAVESQVTTPLQLLLAKVGDKEWHLLDWTSPQVKKWGHVYKGKYPEAAIQAWERQNGYPKGWVQYEVPGEVFKGYVLRGKFKTGEKTYWEEVKDALSDASTWLGIVSLVLSFGGQPWSAWAARAIWASLLSSTAAATINLATMVDKGRLNSLQAVMDVLSIAGNLFGAAGMHLEKIWARGATIKIKHETLGWIKYAYYGEVTSTVLYGVVVTLDGLAEIEEIMTDDDKPLEERLKLASEKIVELGGENLLAYISMRLTKRNVDAMEAGTLNIKDARRLGKRGEELVADERMTTEHETKQKQGKARVDDVPHPAEAPRPSSTFRASKQKPPGWRQSEFDNAVAAAGDRLIGVIRPSRHRLKWEYRKKVKIGDTWYRARPKPKDVTGKTLKTGPDELRGLSSMDPNDPNLISHLEKTKTTYEKVRASLERKGYRILGEEHGYLVVHPKRKEVYYSDLDLHFVVWAKDNPKLGRTKGDDAYTQDWKDEFNQELGGGEPVQHPPRDRWNQRNNPETAGFNVGPAPPVDVITKDGVISLETLEEMERFYREHDMNWERIWKASQN